MSKKTVHEIHIVATNPQGKARLRFCKVCDVITLQTTPLFMLPFTCIANHGMSTKCDGCYTYVETIAKVIVHGEWKYERYCELCCEPNTPEKQEKVLARQKQAEEDAKKPVDLNDPDSIARALGASSHAGKGKIKGGS